MSPRLVMCIAKIHLINAMANMNLGCVHIIFHVLSCNAGLISDFGKILNGTFHHTTPNPCII